MRDLIELTTEVHAALTFHPVELLDEALAIALLPITVSEANTPAVREHEAIYAGSNCEDLAPDVVRNPEKPNPLPAPASHDRASQLIVGVR